MAQQPSQLDPVIGRRVYAWEVKVDARKRPLRIWAPTADGAMARAKGRYSNVEWVRAAEPVV